MSSQYAVYGASVFSRLTACDCFTQPRRRTPCCVGCTHARLSVCTPLHGLSVTHTPHAHTHTHSAKRPLDALHPLAPQQLTCCTRCRRVACVRVSRRHHEHPGRVPQQRVAQPVLRGAVAAVLPQERLLPRGDAGVQLRLRQRVRDRDDRDGRDGVRVLHGQPSVQRAPPAARARCLRRRTVGGRETGRPAPCRRVQAASEGDPHRHAGGESRAEGRGWWS